jgi:hypothetical protein
MLLLDAKGDEQIPRTPEEVVDKEFAERYLIM